MVPNKINKEKLKLNKAQQANGAGIKSNASDSSKGTGSKKNSGVETARLATQSAVTDLNTTEDDEATNGKQMVGGCCVCADDTGYSNNLLVYCDGCDVAVHQGCYGIISVPEGDWFCRRCEFIQKNSVKDSKQVCCQLCAAPDGAIKKTDGNKWAHVVCALFIPEISFGSNRSMEPIIVKDIMPERLNKRCSICEMSTADSNELDGSLLFNTSLVGDGAAALEKKASYTTGHAYVNCNKQGCKHWFHVTCAQAKGLLCEDHSVSQNNVTYCIYCKHHFSKLTSSDIKRIPPFKSQTSTVAPSPKPKPTKQASKRKSLKEPTSTGPPTTPTTDKQTKKTKTSSSVNEPVNSKAADQSTANPSKIAETSDKKIVKSPQRPSRSNSLNNSLSESEQKASNTKKMTKQAQSDPTTNKLNTVKADPIDTLELKQEPKQSQTHPLNLDSIKKEKQPLITNSDEADTKTNSLLELAVETNLASDADDTVNDTKAMEPNNEMINKDELKSAHVDELDCTKRKRAELTEEQLSNQINTPSSSYSSSSSTYSIKSPTGQKRQRTKVPNLELPNSGANTTSSTSKLDTSLVNPQATTPLTPPPSVTQENSSGFVSIMENKFADAFSRSANIVEATSTNKGVNGLPVNALNGMKASLDQVTSSKVNVDMNVDETDDSEDEDGEFPKTLEELLTKQWALGAELISRQSQSFDVMDFVSLLNDCKRENEALEKKLSDLEKSHSDLLKQNEKLQEPLNKPTLDKLKTDQNQSLQNHKPQDQSSSFQPISAPVTTSNAQLVLPKTPVKQSISSLLISASPISSASSPNNSSLQNISFATNSPASTQKNSQQSAIIKNNTINNTSINNNINLISQADSCFYNLNSVNKMNGLKNVNLNYPNNNRNEPNSMDLLASQYQMSAQHNPSNAHSHSQNHHLASALSELTKTQIAQNESPSKQVNNKNTPTNTQMQSIQHQKQIQQQQQQQQQHNLQQALFNMNPYQQQLYYAYLMQQQQAGGSNPIPMDPSMLIPGLVAGTSQTGPAMTSSIPNINSNANTSNSNSSKSIASMSKSTLSNIISKS